MPLHVHFTQMLAQPLYIDVIAKTTSLCLCNYKYSVYNHLMDNVTKL